MSTHLRTHCLLLLLLMPLLVFGQREKKDPANYVVFGLGAPSHSNDSDRYTYMFENHFADIGTATDLTFDWAEIGLRVTEGYHVNKYLALEGGLFFLDKSSILANITTTDGTSAQEKFEVKQWGYDLYALGKYPIRPWLTLTGKLGGAYWWSNTERLVTGEKRDKASARLLIGAGLHSAINDRLLVKLDWSKSDIDNVDFSMITIGLGVNY